MTNINVSTEDFQNGFYQAEDDTTSPETPTNLTIWPDEQENPFTTTAAELDSSDTLSVRKSDSISSHETENPLPSNTTLDLITSHTARSNAAIGNYSLAHHDLNNALSHLANSQREIKIDHLRFLTTLRSLIASPSSPTPIDCQSDKGNATEKDQIPELLHTALNHLLKTLTTEYKSTRRDTEHFQRRILLSPNLHYDLQDAQQKLIDQITTILPSASPPQERSLLTTISYKASTLLQTTFQSSTLSLQTILHIILLLSLTIITSPLRMWYFFKDEFLGSLLVAVVLKLLILGLVGWKNLGKCAIVVLLLETVELNGLLWHEL